MNETLRAESILGPLDEDIDFLQGLLDDIEREQTPGEDVRPDILRRIEAQLAEMPARINALGQLQQDYPEIARELERVKNLSSDVEREFRQWPKTFDPDTLTMLRNLCRMLLKALRLLRVPLVINDRKLRHLRVGDSFDFMEEYQQDLYTELGEDVRPQVLRRLRQDNSVQAWVDEEAGMIYRASTDPKRRFLSFVLVFGIPFVGLLGYIILAPLLQADGQWNAWAVGVNYLFFIAGYVAHIIKKAMEAQKDPLLGNIVTWVHVRESQLAWLGISAWAAYAFIGAFGLFPDLDMYSRVTPTSALTAFSIGFSIDSFLAGALKHYQRKVSDQVSALQARIAT